MNDSLTCVDTISGKQISGLRSWSEAINYSMTAYGLSLILVAAVTAFFFSKRPMNPVHSALRVLSSQSGPFWRFRDESSSSSLRSYGVDDSFRQLPNTLSSVTATVSCCAMAAARSSCSLPRFLLRTSRVHISSIARSAARSCSCPCWKISNPIGRSCLFETALDTCVRSRWCRSARQAASSGNALSKRWVSKLSS